MVCLYLAWVDVKDEPDLEFQVKAWWFLLVLLFHVLGYVVFRVWLAVRRHRRSRNPSPTPVPADVVEAGELERQLEREQVLLAEVEPGDALDPLEPLTHGVRVDVERPGARRHAAAIRQEALQRLDQRRAAPRS